MGMQTFEINGSKLNGQLSTPNTGKGAGVLLLHAWWGLNQFTVQACDRLAQAGFVVLAPDYYQGEVAGTIEEAQAAREKIDRKSVQKLISQAVDYLAELPLVEGSGMGVIGFSLGASFAVEAARSRDEKIKAVVLYYGTGGGKIEKTNAAYLGHFAEHDDWGAHGKKVKAFADRISLAGKEARFFTYPGTKHWFAETDRPEYKLEAAELAWERTIKFLQEQLV
jgi:carboxymethylenebutenolidase